MDSKRQHFILRFCNAHPFALLFGSVPTVAWLFSLLYNYAAYGTAFYNGEWGYLPPLFAISPLCLWPGPSFFDNLFGPFESFVHQMPDAVQMLILAIIVGLIYFAAAMIIGYILRYTGRGILFIHKRTRH